MKVLRGTYFYYLILFCCWYVGFVATIDVFIAASSLRKILSIRTSKLGFLSIH